VKLWISTSIGFLAAGLAQWFLPDLNAGLLVLGGATSLVMGILLGRRE